MRGLVFVLAIAACGGAQGKKVDEGRAGAEPQKQSPCAVTASHVATAVFTWKEPPPTSKENVAQVITERCEGDRWTAEAIACFGKITDEESAKPCITTLTKAVMPWLVTMLVFLVIVTYWPWLTLVVPKALGML